jgi:transposase InsO family protein
MSGKKRCPKLETIYETDDPDYNQDASTSQNLAPRTQPKRNTRTNNVLIEQSESDSSIEETESDQNNETNNTSIFSTENNTNPTTDMNEEQIKTIVRAVIAAQGQIAAKPNYKLELEKLTSSNYDLWAKKMECALQLNQLWVDPTKSVEELTAEEKVKNGNAVLFMTCYLDDQNSSFINQKTRKCFITAWNAIKKFHQPRISTALAEIYSKIRSISHKPGQSIESHLFKLEAQFARMSEIGKELKEEHLVAMILASVRDSPDFANVFHSAMWEEQETLTITKVKSVLIATQRRSHTETDEQALHTKYSRFSKTNQKRIKPHNRQPKDAIAGWKCKTCEMDNHSDENCYKKNRNQQRSIEISKRANKADHDSGDVVANVANTIRTIPIKERLGKTTIRPSPYHNIYPTRTNREPLTEEDALEINYNMEELNYSDISQHSGNQPHKSNQSAKFVPLQAHTNAATIKMTHQTEIKTMNCMYKTNPINNELKKESVWIIDSGATIHMCQSKDLISDFVSSEGQNVIISDGSKIPINGFGTLKILIKDKNNGCEDKIILENVAVVPRLSVNLISVQALASLGVSVKFTENSCFIQHPHKNILFGKVSNSIYTLKILQKGSKINAAMLCIHEWHRRLGHRNIQHLKKIKNTLNLNVNKCNCSDECISCIKGKFHALPFPQESEKPQQPRDVITTDVCGPFRTQSIGGAKYFITFTCANTDYTEVYTMRSRSECKTKLMNFITKCKTQFDAVPKIVRGDRAGEYLDEELQSFLTQHGIVFQCTVPRCSAQNGISERKNRTLADGIRTVLISGNHPKHLWAEALHYVNSTLNNIPKNPDTPSPREKYFNAKCDFPFHEFGSTVYFITNPQNRSKLDDRSSKGIYLGVDHFSKGFRIYSEGKIRVERHVKFIPSQRQIQGHNDLAQHEISAQESIELFEEESDENLPHLRRSERIRSLQANSVNPSKHPFEPKTYKQAMACTEKDKWTLAMDQEINSILQNKTWTEVELPKDRTCIGSKWVYKIKNSENPSEVTYKARLVAQGFTQKFGLDFDEVFAPVTKSSTFRLLLTISSANNLHVQQYDVKSAFLNGELQEEIFMKPPPGYPSTNKVLKLNKSLYGLKQAARVWNQTLHKAMTNEGFIQSKFDECLYVLKTESNVCYAIVHVDDMIFASDSLNVINTKTRALNESFELKNLGKIQTYLGIEVSRDQNNNFAIHQAKYIEKVASEFDLQDAKGSKYPLDPGYHSLTDTDTLPTNEEYRKLIGMLLYISTNTRPDISAAVGILSQRVTKPRQLDYTEARRIVKYLMATKHEKLYMFDRSNDCPLAAYSDSDWAEDRVTRKSISGVICSVFGGSVSWSSRKQNIVSTSTTESEFYAISEAVKEVQWLRNILSDFDVHAAGPITIHADNQSTIKLIENPKFSSRTKHIDVRLHYVRECVVDGKIQLIFCPSEENVADLLTKPLAGVKMKFLRNLAGLHI